MLNPHDKIGPYEINQLLGQGGMAAVYKVWHNELHRYEALKMPLASYQDGEFAVRFLREARNAALQHPHIVAIHNVSAHDEAQLYFTMELIEGGNLADLIQQRKRLSLEETGAILQQVADALDFAHSKGILHRDIKPNNILLQQTLHGPLAKVVDFGISYAAEQEGVTRLTKTGMFIGTPEYMSPEQAGSGATIDHHTDQYSLAIVAYEMLCGQPPFKAESDTSMFQVILQQARDEPPAPRKFLPSLPLRVNDAILRALSKNPNDRFNSCGDFLQEGGLLPQKQQAVLGRDKTQMAPSGTVYICRKCGNKIPHGQAFCEVCEKPQVEVDSQPSGSETASFKLPESWNISQMPKVLLASAAVVVLIILMAHFVKTEKNAIVSISSIPARTKHTEHNQPKQQTTKTSVAHVVKPSNIPASSTFYGVYQKGDVNNPNSQTSKPGMTRSKMRESQLPSEVNKPTVLTAIEKKKTPKPKVIHPKNNSSSQIPVLTNTKPKHSDTSSTVTHQQKTETPPEQDDTKQVEVNQPNGAHYKGQTKNGAFEGYGVYTSPGGTRFEGEFHNGSPVDSKGKWTLQGK